MLDSKKVVWARGVNPGVNRNVNTEPRINDFPSCCGARVLSDFLFYKIIYLTDPIKARFILQLQNLKLDGVAVVTAITTEHQKLGNQLLAFAGFKRHPGGVNGNSNNGLYLWSLVLNNKKDRNF